MKTFKELNESLKWEQKWTLTLDNKGKKIYDYYSTDGKFKLTMTGYYMTVGRFHATKKNVTSWMVEDLTTGKTWNSVFSTLPKAKKAVEKSYESS